MPAAAIAAEAPAVPAVAVKPDAARPLESGARNSAATIGPLAIGAPVKDPTGAEIGRIVLLTTDKRGRSIVKLRRDEDVFTVPADQPYTRGGAAFSRVALDALKRGGGAIAADNAR